MRSKVCSIGVIFIFAMVLFVVGEPSGYFAGKKQIEQKNGTVIIWQPPLRSKEQKDRFSDEGQASVREHIKEVHAMLDKLTFRGPLDKQMCLEIADFFGCTGVLIKYDGTRAVGKWQIYQYLMKESRNIRNIKFNLECVYAEELTHNLAGDDEEDILHIAYLTFSYTFDYNGEPIDPSGSRDDYHIRNCDWRN